MRRAARAAPGAESHRGSARAAPVPRGRAANSRRDSPPAIAPGDRSIPSSSCQILFITFDQQVLIASGRPRLRSIDSTTKRTSSAPARSRQISRPVGEKRFASFPAPVAISMSSGSRSDFTSGGVDPLQVAFARIGVGRVQILLGAQRAFVPRDPIDARLPRVGDDDLDRRTAIAGVFAQGRAGSDRGSPPPGGVKRTFATCWLEWTTRRIRSPAVIVLANGVGRAAPRTASRTARTKLGSIGQSLPARSAVVVQSRTRPSPRIPLDHRGRPAGLFQRASTRT